MLQQKVYKVKEEYQRTCPQKTCSKWKQKTLKLVNIKMTISGTEDN